MYRKIVSLPALIIFCIMVLPVVSAYAGPGCKDLPGEPGYFPDLEMESGGMTRTYNLYVHPRYKNSRPTPLVLNFHGYGGTNHSQEAYSNLLEKADKYKFILVSPLGIGLSWNAGACCGQAVADNIDDVGFVSDLIDKISAEYCINPDRIFSTGMSNGGFLSYRLACELSDRIAAIAPVAATNRMPTCEPTRPVPVISFNGTDDPLVSHEHAWSTIEWWAENNGCTDETTVVYQKGDVTCVAYEDCEEDASVKFCSVEGGGHNWPGSYDLCEIRPDTCWWSGYTTQDVDAALKIWKFLAEHTFPDED
jgi:polyhydroxybutyrate depolymerase